MSMNLQGVSSYGVSTYSRFNLSHSQSDISVFVGAFSERVLDCLRSDELCIKRPFKSFAEKRLSVADLTWLQDNDERFLDHTANKSLVKVHYLSECGFICSMIFSEDGEHVIVGHSSGLIQVCR